MIQVIVFCWGIMIGLLYGFSTIDSKQIEHIKNVCSNNQGIDKVIVNVMGSNEVYCKDGAKFRIKEE